MPQVKEFLESFGLTENQKIAGFTITSVTSSHESIKRYYEYYYKIQLEFSGAGDPKELLQFLMNLSAQEHVVYGIKNPYLCTIDKLTPENFQKERGGYQVRLYGHAVRTG